MKTIINLILILVVLSSCKPAITEENPVKDIDWAERKAAPVNFSGYSSGQTYLPVYSHIYHVHEQRTFNLTITASIRNISPTDTMYITKADYYNTSGENIRRYLSFPVFVRPMETLEIVIAEEDQAGGSGANFVFTWAVKNPANPPLFEAAMISTYGQQGLSFTTRGVQIFE
jgi:hypothetical protein